MKTSNVVGITAAAALLTALEIGLAATLLGSGVIAEAQPAARFEQPQVQDSLGRFTLEPIVVVASNSD